MCHCICNINYALFLAKFSFMFVLHYFKMIALKTLMKTTAFQSLVSQSILYENRKFDPMIFLRPFANDNYGTVGRLDYLLAKEHLFSRQDTTCY